MSKQMPPYVYIEDLPERVGQEVTLRGWLYRKRSSGKVRFLILRDGTGLVQGVMVKNKIPDEDFAALRHDDSFLHRL